MEFAWWLLAVLVVISALGGSAASAAIRRRWREEQGDQGMPLISPGAWGEPDVAPPRCRRRHARRWLISRRCGRYLRTVRVVNPTKD